MTDLKDLIAVPFSMIPATPVEPLWPGWIPYRHVTLVVAPGGTSKGLWTTDIMARVTTGKAFPGEPVGAVREPQAVILIAPEDDPNETVAWRLAAAGADTSLVRNLTVLPDGSQFMLDNLAELRAAFEQTEKETGRRVGLVVVDPLLAVVKTKSPGRADIWPLELFAQEKRCAVVVPHHTVKSGAVAGLKELTNACRNVLRIERPDKASKKRVVTIEKSNMSDDTAQLAYTLVGEGTATRVCYPSEVQDQLMTPARGYVIATDSAAAYETATGTPQPPPAASSWQTLVIVQGGKPKSLGGGYADAATARKRAETEAGHPLPWTDGDQGSQYAGTVIAGGKVVAYTVFPNTSTLATLAG